MKNNIFLSCILLLLGFGFFGSVVITIPSYITKITIIAVSLLGFYKTRDRNLMLRKWLSLILVFLILSCIVSYFTRGQNPLLTLLASSITYCLFTYFFFSYRKVTNKQYEKVIFILSLLYCILYIFQVFNKNIILFNMDEAMASTDTTRLRLAGTPLSTLGYMYFLNKYETTKKKINILYWSICLFCIILLGFRTILISVIFATLLFYINRGIKMRFLVTLFVLGGIVFFILNNTVASSIIEDMIERNETESFDNKDYVRILGFNSYWNDYLLPIEKIFGCGNAYSGSSTESDIINSKIGIGAVWVDWGIIGLGFYNGMITVFLSFLCLLIAIFTPISKDLFYLKAWLVIIILSSVTSGEYVRVGNTLLIAFVITFIEKNKIYEKTSNINNYSKLLHRFFNR